MSKGAARKGDTCTGHPPCFPPRANTQGSSDVFINGKGAHRKDDAWMLHICQGKKHDSKLARGSATVFVNGRQQGRIADPVLCGSKVATGSSDVFVGEEGYQDSSGNSISLTPTETTDGSEGGTVPYYGSPGGGGTPGTYGGFTNSGSGYAHSGGFQQPTIVDGQLGNLSKQYESGSRGAAAIGYDNTGGYSYGTYQIATKTGTMSNYLKYLQNKDPVAYASLQAAGGLNAATRGDPKFQDAWKDLAANDPQFAASQHDFIQATHYDPVVNRLQGIGLDVNTRSPALRDVVWSTAVQHGANNNVIQNALQGRNISQMSDAEIINAVYNERGSRTPSGALKYFKKSDADTQVSIANRFKNERQTALSVLG